MSHKRRTREEPRRKHKRLSVVRTGMLDVDGKSVKCIIRDISHGGARLKPLGCHVAEGACGSLKVPGLGDLECEVIWSRGGELGMRFRDEFPVEPYAALEPSDISDVLALIARKRRRGAGGL